MLNKNKVMYSQKLIDKVKEFWYIFDERYTYFLPDVASLYLNCNLLKHNSNSNDPSSYIYNFDWIFFTLQNKMRLDAHNYEDLFLKELDLFKDGIISLANDQINTISKNLDFKEIQKAAYLNSIEFPLFFKVKEILIFIFYFRLVSNIANKI